MAKTDQLRCQLITPDRQVFDMEVDSVVYPAHDGEVGVLKNRAPLLHKLGIGVCRISTSEGQKRYFLDSGFVQVLGNTLTMLTEDAQGEDEIDRDEAQRELQEAEGLPRKTQEEMDNRRRAILRAKAKLAAAGR